MYTTYKWLSVILPCSRRSGVVTTQEREKYWKFLSLYYVTEESDDPDNPNGIIEHHLPWRSKSESHTYTVASLLTFSTCIELDEFMVVLDRRLSKTQQQQPVGLVAKKVRRVGEPSSQPPPPGAPVWAVKKDVQEAMQGACYCLSHLLLYMVLIHILR